MTIMTKRLVAIALSGAILMPAIQAAEAGDRGGWRGDRGGKHYQQQRRHHNKNNQKHHGRRHNNNNDNVGAAVAAGIIGLAAGAILLGATSQPSYAAPPPANYYPRTPYPGRVSGVAGYQPWSPAWYRYCSNKFRSFNPSTGTYTTYQGAQRFCQ